MARNWSCSRPDAADASGVVAGVLNINEYRWGRDRPRPTRMSRALSSRARGLASASPRTRSALSAMSFQAPIASSARSPSLFSKWPYGAPRETPARAPTARRVTASGPPASSSSDAAITRARRVAAAASVRETIRGV
jgi:hypothetical protein